jgi:tryptophan-rich sensory protein
MEKKIIQILNIFAVIFALVLNGLANALPINGRNTGEISDSIPNLFVPAGLTFAIWGVIYLLIGVFAIFQARDIFKTQKEDMPFLEQIGPWFVIGQLANGVWILFWHYGQISISVAVMLVLLASLLISYQRLNVGRNLVAPAEKMAVHTMVSVYLGWISVATIANITALLVTEGWNRWGISEATWTVLVIIVAIILGVLMLIMRKDIAYTAVIIWSLIGIALKRSDPQFIPQPVIVAISWVGIAILIIISLYQLWKQINNDNK